MKRWLTVIILAMLFLTGLGLVLYPAISDWYIGRHQAEVVANYDKKAAELSKHKIEDELEKARRYNDSLLGNVVLTDPFDEEALREQNTEYEELLNIDNDGVMGSVDIPAIDVYLPIYHGTDSEVLKKGIGHLQNSSLPVGGKGTHTVVSGHTALPSAEMFNRLSELEERDVFYIHVLNETLAYEIDQIKIVLPENIEDLLINKDEDYITLVTCTPYGINSHRLLVRGTRIPYEETAEKAVNRKANTAWNKWKAYIAAAIVAAVLIMASITFYIWKKKNRR